MSLAHRMFKKAFQRGRSERRGEALTVFTRPPTACRNRRFPRPYVEPLSDARTKLKEFFNILLRGSR
jgi:hypothetical protein